MEMQATLRRCIGSTTFGIEPHEAPISAFPKQPSQKDGLGRMCTPHWSRYTAALRTAALARKAGTEPIAPEPEPMVPDPPVVTSHRARAPKVAAETKPVRAKAGTRTRERRVAGTLPTAAALERAQALLAATETLAGAAYTQAVGSDAVQAALAVLGSRDSHVDTALTEGTEEADLAIAG